MHINLIMRVSWQVVRQFCGKPKRKEIISEQIRKEKVDEYTHIITDKYSFLLQKDLPYLHLY